MRRDLRIDQCSFGRVGNNKSWVGVVGSMGGEELQIMNVDNSPKGFCYKGKHLQTNKWYQAREVGLREGLYVFVFKIGE